MARRHIRQNTRLELESCAATVLRCTAVLALEARENAIKSTKYAICSTGILSRGWLCCPDDMLECPGNTARICVKCDERFTLLYSRLQTCTRSRLLCAHVRARSNPDVKNKVKIKTWPSSLPQVDGDMAAHILRALLPVSSLVALSLGLARVCCDAVSVSQDTNEQKSISTR